MKRLETWWVISLILSVFGFLKELRPSEPYIFEFLTGEWRNITADVVTQQVYPVGTYSYLAQLIVVFLITDLCRYKPLIIVLALSGIVIWSMLLWTSGLVELKILEVFYGTFMATEVVYYSYIYAKVKNEYYEKVTSYARAAVLAGRFVSSVLAQLLISFKIMDYRQLNYITFAAMLGAFLWSLLIPSVETSIYFHTGAKAKLSFRKKAEAACELLKTHFTESFSQTYVVKWSLWWSLATSAFIQVQNYMQPLWKEIGDNGDTYNGVVEALLTIMGCVGALLVGYLKVDWTNKGELLLSICSMVSATFIIISSQATSVILSYVCYVLYGGFYHCMITIASMEIAKKIPTDSYGLVFGINTFLALLVSTLLTMVFVTGTMGWSLAIRDQHLVYGFYNIVITVIFIIIGTISWYRSRRDITRRY
ncbi:thiamine transporter 2 [Agrilus planipennis]|uniref:Thiamine transporter 2 n=1 Tax=Agrilus planipennis TaxID=224129 RepID=A0A1W4W680_AGRPL|nr:thiamine transporter 2 [Agrilus planipennis]